jgi:hypothetical protein
MKHMKTILLSIALSALTILTGCANSGFAVATQANTARQANFEDGFLEQAATDMLAINACFLRAGKIVVTSGDGTPVGLGAIMSAMQQSQCTMMAQSLRLVNTMLYAFLAKPELSRVPAAPEEIVQSIIKDGMKFALMKFGIGAVQKVVESGQVAQAQIASEGIAAAQKPPLVVDKPVIVQVPLGSSVVPTEAAPAVTP